MVSEGMIKFNRWMALIVGGIVGIGYLVYMIFLWSSGKSVPIGNIIFMVCCLSTAIWGFKELKK